jgi:N-acetylglucosaminyldiphosphoundecaprenol N-acetyl-beta-D-mannosaminyltransferase
LQSTHIFGLDVLTGKEEDIFGYIVQRIEKNQKSFIVTLNSTIVVRSHNDETYKNTIKASDMIIPDGSGIVWALKRNSGISSERITGVDTMVRLCKMSREKNWKVYLLGARKEVVEKTAAHLEEQFGTNVVGYHDGYFKNDEEISTEIEKLKPDLLFVALGIPRQEEWILRNRNLPFKLAMGVGGSFDVISGCKKRAPQLFQKFKLEWLYRWLQSPIKKRAIPGDILKFTWIVLRNKQ